jgi:hypothetical protein
LNIPAHDTKNRLRKVNSDGKNSTNINKTNNLLSPLSPGLEQALPCGLIVSFRHLSAISTETLDNRKMMETITGTVTQFSGVITVTLIVHDP